MAVTAAVNAVIAKMEEDMKERMARMAKDLSGELEIALTKADVEDPGFGVAIAVRNFMGAVGTASVARINITVHYAASLNITSNYIISTNTGFQDTYGGNQDAFLVKFDSNGSRLWATYYGGTGGDYG